VFFSVLLVFFWCSSGVLLVFFWCSSGFFWCSSVSSNTRRTPEEHQKNPEKNPEGEEHQPPRELPEPGAYNFACGANYLQPFTRVVQLCLRRELPTPGTKGGAILYLCGE
jgi:hypothetical protein